MYQEAEFCYIRVVAKGYRNITGVVDLNIT